MEFNFHYKCAIQIRPVWRIFIFMYHVYIIRAGDYFYYGVTSDIYTRSNHHAKLVFASMQGIKERRILKIHTVVAKRAKRLGTKTTLLEAAFYLRLSSIFSTKEKADAEHVENLLISLSLSNPKCCNKRVQTIKIKTYDNL